MLATADYGAVGLSLGLGLVLVCLAQLAHALRYVGIVRLFRCCMLEPQWTGGRGGRAELSMRDFASGVSHDLKSASILCCAGIPRPTLLLASCLFYRMPGVGYSGAAAIAGAARRLG